MPASLAGAGRCAIGRKRFERTSRGHSQRIFLQMFGWLIIHVGGGFTFSNFPLGTSIPPQSTFLGHRCTAFDLILCGGWILYVRPTVSHCSLLNTFTTPQKLPWLQRFIQPETTCELDRFDRLERLGAWYSRQASSIAKANLCKPMQTLSLAQVVVRC